MNLTQHLRSFVGIKSPSLEQRKLTKRMIEEMREAIHGKKE
jgi:hypothetical protein